MSTLNVPGLKEIIKTAFQNKKFMTNGRTLPDVDFDQMVGVEVTALDSLNLWSLVECEDDRVVEIGKRFERELYLQMAPGCVYEDAVIALLCDTSKSFRDLFVNVKKVRVCIKHYSLVPTPEEQREREVSAAVMERWVNALMSATAPA
jgi:hypothetical protein